MYILDVARNTLSILRMASLKKYLILQLFFLLSAVMQVLGIASIAPFIGILSNPSIIQSNQYLNNIYLYFGFSSDFVFIITFAWLTIGLIILSNIVYGITLWLTFQYSVSAGAKIQSDLFKNFLHRNYLYHKSSNYNDQISLISNEVPRFIYMVLQPFLLFANNFLISVAILMVLLFVNPIIALSSGLIIGLAYLMTYVALRKMLSHHGRVVSARNSDVQSILSEAFSGIKDIKLRGSEKRYLNRFDLINAKGLASNSAISLFGDIPKLIIESISFSAILLLAIYLLMSGVRTENVISILSLYAVAGYKLLPSMQQMYKSLTNISANGQVAGSILHELLYVNRDESELGDISIEKPVRMEINNISFSYADAKLVLSDISAKLYSGTLNTVVGPSGSGKSTFADILLGLISPHGGMIIVNGRALSRSEHYHLKRHISYVPQSIFISNSDVITNVTFGDSNELVDMDRLLAALNDADALDFVNNLPNGLSTILGQNGQLLSGGQRQRIGIARALYHDASILVLDEPTSALDIESEYEIMQVLHHLKDKILIIIISHRPAAIKMSDNILMMKDGKIVDQGSYEHLIRSSDDFKLLIKKGDANMDQDVKR